jgi:hypothetical protein
MPIPTMPVSTRTRRVAIAIGATTTVGLVVLIARSLGGDGDDLPGASTATSDMPIEVSTTIDATSTVPTPTMSDAVTTSVAPDTAPSSSAPDTTPVSADTVAATTLPLPVEAAPPTGVLFTTSFDTPGTALDNGMLLPSFGPHLTPRPGIAGNGALFRDPNMAEWEDVLVRAPVGPLEGDRYIEAVVTVESNGADAHPAIMFFDDPGTTSGGCAGGSTMDWAEVDPWNNMEVGKISFVRDGCYDASTHVFAGKLGDYQTYTVRAEIVGDTISMRVNGTVTARTTLPADLDLPFAGLRLGQFGNDGGYEQYRIEEFTVGLL